MLNAIIAFSLRNRAVVLAAALLVTGCGLWTATRMPIDVLPDLNRPTVTIMTEAHGLTPEGVERLVTWPIEQVLNGATGVTRVRSASGAGLSVVWVEFGWGSDIYLDRQIVTEKLQMAVPKLPTGTLPSMAPISSIMGQILLIGFQSRTGQTDTTALRLLLDRDIVPRLLSISGVAQIVSIGGQPTELQVIADTRRLRAHDVALPELPVAIARANAGSAAGTFPLGERGPQVAVSGLVRGERDLALAVVRAQADRPILVEDVADVTFGPATQRMGDAGIDGSPGVILVVMKQPDTDTVALTDRILAEISQAGRELPGDVEVLPDLFQQAAFIHRAIDNVLVAVRDGGILVVAILFLFLMNLRTTVITLTAIPISVAVAAIVFRAFGQSINTMTLGGLAVAIGALVDDAIVDVENIYRRLHLNAASMHPRPAIEVVFHASSEVRKPILYGTLLVIVVYLPLFFLSGIEGRLFTPIGLAYIVSVAASLVVALTVTPVLSFLLLRWGPLRHGEYGSRLVHLLKRVVHRMIRISLAHAPRICAVLIALVALAIGVLASLGSSFLPAFNEGTAQVNLILPPDTGIDTSDRYGSRLEAVLREVEGVQHVGRRTGRAPGDEHAMPVSVSEAIVTFDPDSDRSREEIIEEIRDRLGTEFPGVITATEQPLAHLLSHLLSGVTAQVAIKISGPGLDILRQAARKAEAALRPIRGVRDLYTEPQVMVDQVEVVPRRDLLARHGLTVEDVAHTVELAMGGEEVARMQVGAATFPIVVRLREEDRRSLDQLRHLYVQRNDGGRLLLSDIAEVRMSKTPNNINRENASRRIVVQHNVAGRALGDVVADVDRALEGVREDLSHLPGYALRISGQFEAQQAATRLIAVLSVASLAAMFLILYLHFESVNLALQVLASVPMAFIGGVAYVAFSGQELSVATLVGLIALGGIAARNGILLVDHYLHLMREEGESFRPEMILRAGEERMVPVLMTALASGIGLVPLALAPDQPGREILYPVATVIIGGLLSSTLLDFLVHPGLFWRFGRRAAEKAVADAKEASNAPT